MSKPTRYDFVYELPIAWGDMDSFGHVNNVAYVRYFETARVQFFLQKGLWDPADKTRSEGPVLTHIEMNYRKQVTFPAVLEISLDITSVTSRGCEMSASFWSQGDCILTGTASMVWIDFKTGKPKTLGEEFAKFKK